jgi:hypothetical protein
LKLGGSRIPFDVCGVQKASTVSVSEHPKDKRLEHTFAGFNPTGAGTGAATCVDFNRNITFKLRKARKQA